MKAFISIIGDFECWFLTSSFNGFVVFIPNEPFTMVRVFKALFCKLNAQVFPSFFQCVQVKCQKGFRIAFILCSKNNVQE